MTGTGGRLVPLTMLTMLAFAGNSVLNRMAVGSGSIDPVSFAALRVLAGALTLMALVVWRKRRWPGWSGRMAGVAGLTVYLIGFSLAYLALDAGTGALILFGAVQVTMFAGAVIAGDAVPPRRWLGAGVALAGLALLIAPSGAAPSGWHAGLMAVAGFGWGIYSLAGRGARDALAATAANFVLSAPLLVLAALFVPGDRLLTPTGAGLAVISGAVTSGLGYALWYAILPGLGASRAGLAQLTVPVLAALGGVLLMGEAVGWRFAAAAGLVLGGVLIGMGQNSHAKP